MPFSASTGAGQQVRVAVERVSDADVSVTISKLSITYLTDSSASSTASTGCPMPIQAPDLHAAAQSSIAQHSMAWQSTLVNNEHKSQRAYGTVGCFSVLLSSQAAGLAHASPHAQSCCASTTAAHTAVLSVLACSPIQHAYQTKRTAASRTAHCQTPSASRVGHLWVYSSLYVSARPSSPLMTASGSWPMCLIACIDSHRWTATFQF